MPQAVSNDAAFRGFCIQRKRDLERIAARTRNEFEPGPWRRYRLQRVPVQLALFELDCELPLESPL